MNTIGQISSFKNKLLAYEMMADSGTIHLENNANQVESPPSCSTQPMEEEKIEEEDLTTLNTKGIKHIHFNR